MNPLEERLKENEKEVKEKCVFRKAYEHEYLIFGYNKVKEDYPLCRHCNGYDYDCRFYTNINKILEEYKKDG